jgi:tetratricopeptide (TPR) repeat protein
MAAGAAGALVCLIALSLASFPLEMPGTIALAGVALGLLAANERGEAASARVARPAALVYAPVAAACLLVPLAAVRAERSIRGSRWLGAAERALHRDIRAAGAAEALVDLERCLEATPGDYRARLRTAQMLLRQGRAEESVRAAQRALSIEPFAPNARAALAAAELGAGDAASARKDASLALELLEDYPDALHIRARASERLGDREAAEADRERLRALAAGASDEDTARTARWLIRPPEPSE